MNRAVLSVSAMTVVGLLAALVFVLVTAPSHERTTPLMRITEKPVAGTKQ